MTRPVADPAESFLEPSAGESSALVDRLKRNDGGDRRMRQAVAELSALVRDLPQTDDLLLTPGSRAHFRCLRDGHPEIYLTYRAEVRRKAGAHLVGLLDHYIGPPPATGPSREVLLLGVEDLLAQPPVEWRVDRVIPEKGFGVIYGESTSGKTFFTGHLSASIALGRAFFLRSVRQAPVLYVAGEGRMRDRIAAEMQAQGVAPAELDMRFVEQGLDLCGVTADLEKLERHVLDYQPGVIVIDTLARVAGGGDENSGQDMGKLLLAFKRLEEASGGIVLVVHHTGKDAGRGARGHSSLRAAADVEIEVSRGADGVRTARVSKLRDGEDGAEFHFQLERQQLDDERNSCIVVPEISAPTRPKSVRTFTANEKLCLAALDEEISANGETLPATSAIPAGKRGVEIDAWRTRFYARTGEDVAADSRRTLFRRAKEGLLAKTSIGCWERWVWRL